MIDGLFGSKTRVKLLHLFFNNPGKPFYVREITRKIDEQINSVRRELANMMKVGVVVSTSVDNKLYYEVNGDYEHYGALLQIFADEKPKAAAMTIPVLGPHDKLVRTLASAVAVVASGPLSGSPHTAVDLLIVGPVAPVKLRTFIKEFEALEGRTINYTTMPLQEFYYRLSIRDKFVADILREPRTVLKDVENIVR